MKTIPCNTCGSLKFNPLFEKKSNLNEIFTVVRCKNCSLVQVNPQPSFEEVLKYYSNDYFTKRSDRGYDNYYSEKIRIEIERVFVMNLKDLDFFTYEDSLTNERSTIDIGCAAGYFVSFMKNRGWNSKGIEIAKEPVDFARNVLGLEIYQEDFLEWDRNQNFKFDLITLWASIEHLHKPKETLEKIYLHLKPKGRMLLSTCRYGLLATIMGPNWRFFNVPEHLYYYSLNGISNLAQNIGFKKISHITYGSGFTGQRDLLYNTAKSIIDPLVKWTDQGDMMAIQFEKI
jgi:SAM-dependent methyltransferase